MMSVERVARGLVPSICRACRQASSRSPQYAPRTARRWNSIAQRPGSDRVLFPGAVNSKFTTSLEFTSSDEKNAMPTYRIMDQDGAIVDKTRGEPDISEEALIKLYRDMLTVSIMDVIMFDAQRQGRLSFYMVSAGEEGISVGAASALHPKDVVFAQYREQGVLQNRGFTLDNFMNQLFSNRKDLGLGRNMPVHYGSKELEVHSISSPLATQLPHASGAAYALKLRKLQGIEAEPRVVACFFGEGAASEGDFHAALNIAATRNCPVIFICRNNGYAISTPTLEQYRGDGIASRGVGYGIDTVRVDGNDIFAVREVIARAREAALEGTGKPILVEAMSYRVSHHSTSDDSFAYRARVEVEDWKRRDNPIVRLRKYMERKGMWDEEREKDARASLRKDILAAFSRAEKEKKPNLKWAFEGVYEHMTEEQIAQMKEMRDMVDRYPDEYDLDEFEGGKEGLTT